MLLQPMGFRTSRAIWVAAALVALIAGSLGAIADTATRATPAGAVGAPSRIITYEVRGLDNGSDLESFAAQAAETYADPRGWSLGGSVAFVRVPSGGSFTLWLAAPGRVPGFGSPCSSLYSCRQGRNVIINEARWLGASPSWNAAGAALRDYRHMVVNHETGHWIGFGHAGCGGPGAPAPVMQQQSISLQGCAPNSWPLDSERHAAAAASRCRDPLRQPLRGPRAGPTLAPRGARDRVGDRPRHRRARHRPDHGRRRVVVRRGAGDAPRRRRRVPGLRTGPRLQRDHPGCERAALRVRVRVEHLRRRQHRAPRLSYRRRRLTVRHGRARGQRPAHRARVRMGDRSRHARVDVGARLRERRRDGCAREPDASRRRQLVPGPWNRPRLRPAGRRAARSPQRVCVRHQHRRRRHEHDARVPHDHRRRRAVRRGRRGPHRSGPDPRQRLGDRPRPRDPGACARLRRRCGDAGAGRQAPPERRRSVPALRREPRLRPGRGREPRPAPGVRLRHRPLGAG